MKTREPFYCERQTNLCPQCKQQCGYCKTQDSNYLNKCEDETDE